MKKELLEKIAALEKRIETLEKNRTTNNYYHYTYQYPQYNWPHYPSIVYCGTTTGGWQGTSGTINGGTINGGTLS